MRRRLAIAAALLLVVLFVLGLARTGTPEAAHWKLANGDEANLRIGKVGKPLKIHYGNLAQRIVYGIAGTKLPARYGGWIHTIQPASNNFAIFFTHLYANRTNNSADKQPWNGMMTLSLLGADGKSVGPTGSRSVNFSSIPFNGGWIVGAEEISMEFRLPESFTNSLHFVFSNALVKPTVHEFSIPYRE